MYEYNFRNADDPIKQRIWKERMAPYIEAPDYPVVSKIFDSKYGTI